MSFTNQQIALLSGPLDSSAVKERTQGGAKVSYIEAYHAENEANRIFGFDAWDRETSLEFIGEREHDGKWRVYYRAKVRITVRTPDGRPVVREGCGYGSGIDRDIGQAHESALKEAESDAEKRALKTFGNPFGQALYDKSQSNVAKAPPPLIDEGQWAELVTLAEQAQADMPALCKFYSITSLRELPAPMFERVRKTLNKKISDAQPKEKAA